MPPLLSLNALQANARDLAGKKIKDVCHDLSFLKHNDKGSIGQIFEKILGATSGTLAQPDFAHLGIELKTIPIVNGHRVKESTFICVASLLPEKISFLESGVYQKLKHVLFVPYQGEKDIPLLERDIGTPFFWQPNQTEFNILKNDYEELMHKIIMGESASLRALLGQALQIRPKGQNKTVLTQAIDSEGETLWVNARGFYLRPTFTESIIRRVFENT